MNTLNSIAQLVALHAAQYALRASRLTIHWHRWGFVGLMLVITLVVCGCGVPQTLATPDSSPTMTMEPITTSPSHANPDVSPTVPMVTHAPSSSDEVSGEMSDNTAGIRLSLADNMTMDEIDSAGVRLSAKDGYQFLIVRFDLENLSYKDQDLVIDLYDLVMQDADENRYFSSGYGFDQKELNRIDMFYNVDPDDSSSGTVGKPGIISTELQTAGADDLLKISISGGVATSFHLAFIIPDNASPISLVWPGFPIFELSNSHEPIADVGLSTSITVPPSPISAASPAPTSASLPDTRLDIYSYPAGAGVFVASLDELGITPSDVGSDMELHMRNLLGLNRLSQMDFGTAVMNSNDEKYRVGVAPLSVPLAPGIYIVHLTMPDTVRYPADSPFFNWLEDGSTFGMSSVGTSNGIPGIAYLVEITENDALDLIQLWQPRQATLAEIEEIYPEEELYAIVDADIRAELEGNIPESDIPTVLRLLKKAGKVVYRQDENHRLIIQIDLQTGALDTLLRYED